MTMVSFPLGATPGVQVSVNALTTIAPQVVQFIRTDQINRLRALLDGNGIPDRYHPEAVRQLATGFFIGRTFDRLARSATFEKVRPLKKYDIEMAAQLVSMGKIIIRGLDKALVLVALYNNLSPPPGREKFYTDKNYMTKEEAREILSSGQTYFDYLKGREMRIGLSGDELVSWWYNRVNGHHAAEKAIALLILYP